MSSPHLSRKGSSETRKKAALAFPVRGTNFPAGLSGRRIRVDKKNKTGGIAMYLSVGKVASLTMAKGGNASFPDGEKWRKGEGMGKTFQFSKIHSKMSTFV